MGLNLDPLLAIQSDFSDFRDISKNIDSDRINNYIREAQINEIRAFLGGELYLALVEDYDAESDVFGTQRFTDLWFGVDYEYQGYPRRFYGLKPVLIYFAYARIIIQNQVNVTRYGVQTMSDDFAADVTDPQIRTKANDARSMGILYQSDAWDFIDQKRSDYQEWNRYDENTPRKKSFKFKRIY